MSDWTSGYVAEIGYTYGYYTELNPARARFALMAAGWHPPQLTAASELGFGQGLSINIHAAGGTLQWSGTDFNPAQAAFAQDLARASGAPAAVVDEAFAQYCTREDLPEFDFIGLHGIWSWISDDNRRLIVDFVRRKLRVGGVLYISYNTLPGWAAFAPMRHLMTEYAQVMTGPGAGIVQRVDAALAFCDSLIATNPTYARANPQVAERLKKVREQNRHYLAHEYFNRDWHPMHFATMAEWLEPAKLSYACSASFGDHVDAINLSAEQQALLKTLPDAGLRESVRDFMINQQFRRDYWVKGARPMAPAELAEALRAERVVLTTPRADIALKTTGALGEATLAEAIYAPLLDALADHKVRSIGELERMLQGRNVNFQQLRQAIAILVHNNQVAPAQADAATAKARKQTDRLNAHLARKARTSPEMSYVASPVTGGGHAIGRFGLLFLDAVGQNKKQAGELAAHAWAILAAQGQRLVKDGKPVESPDDNLAELTQQARTFLDKQGPILKALQVL